MIKINLVREGRAVRGAGAAPGAGAGAAAGPSNLNTYIIAGVAILGGLGAFGWWFTKNSELNQKNEAITSKQAEAQRLESIIKEVDDYTKRKDSLQRRIDLINQLKQNQKGPVKVMDQISRDLPDLVWLETMKVSGAVISISGKALNPNAVANFVDNIKNDPLFEEPELSNLTQVTVTPVVYGFDMSFHFTTGPKPESGAAGAATATGTSGTSGTATSTAAKK